MGGQEKVLSQSSQVGDRPGWSGHSSSTNCVVDKAAQAVSQKVRFQICHSLLQICKLPALPPAAIRPCARPPASFM